MQNMRPVLPTELLSRLSEIVAIRTGLYFPPERWSDLERGIAAAASDFNCPDLESCAHWLLSAPLSRHMTEILASCLSIGETYFFREKQNLNILEERILIPLIQSRRQHGQRLRIWSAGCSTGEEAYTIAILLNRLIPDLKAWNITILATDFNPQALRKAAQGVYGEWSFRNAPAGLRERYFNKRSDGRYEIQSYIREMVTFSYLNLADDVYPSLSNNTSAMDVILCRNVLMYFTPQLAKHVAGKFYHSLVTDGWLIVSPTETSNSLFSPLMPVAFPGAVLYRKGANTDSGSYASKYEVVQPSEPAETVIPVLPDVQQQSADAEISAVRDELRQSPQPAASESLSDLAHHCANQGRLDEALAWCEKAIAVDRLNPSLHYLGAAILLEQGRHDLAGQWLMRTLYLDPDFVLAHFSLGNLHQSQGRYRQAQRHFKNVLTLLHHHQQNEILQEADGLTAGRLAEIVTSMLDSLPQLEVNV
ncbi:MAG: CheR family methyltransferase [Sulfuriferula sp.]|nr:CheR family methyltransferase [Sulfuriferula sp.]